MKRLVVAVCAAVVAGCSTQAESAPAPTSAAPEPAAVVRGLLLPESVTGPAGLVKSGEPVDGVQPLVPCPELPSAAQAVTGVTATWTWSGGGRTATVTQYNAVYRDISGKDVVKQARTATSCYRGWHVEVEAGKDLDEYLYDQDSLGTTKPFVDDRYAYCVRNRVTHHSICVAVQAKGDKVVRLTIDRSGEYVTGAPSIENSQFAQAVTDRLVA